MTILELMQKRSQALEAARNFAESHRTDKGHPVRRGQRDPQQDGEGDHGHEQRDFPHAASGGHGARALPARQHALTGKPMTGGSPAPAKTGRASDEYRSGMLQALRTNFRQISNVLQEGVDADGGYLVPEEYDHRLIDTLQEENIMRKLGHVITTSGEHKINIAATKPAAAWIEEGGSLQFSDATFAQILMDAHKLHVAIKVTEELLYDNAFNLENYIITEFGKALANAEEDAFLNGTGVGQPLGLFAEDGGGTTVDTLTAALSADDLFTPRLRPQEAVPQERGLHHERPHHRPDPQVQGQQRRVHLAALLSGGRAGQDPRLQRLTRPSSRRKTPLPSATTTTTTSATVEPAPSSSSRSSSPGTA